MVYVFFLRQLRLRKREFKIVRFSNAKKAAEGIVTLKNTWWHAVAAVQGRQRNIPGLEEEV
jgi:hypothetical protein